MIDAFRSFYGPSYPTVLVYMLQSTEYNVNDYLKWYWSTTNFHTVRYRGDLKRTKAARQLLLSVRIGIVLQIVIGLLLIGLWYMKGVLGGWQFGLALLIIYPVLWAHLLVVPLLLGRLLVVAPKNKTRIQAAQKAFTNHPAIKIAVAGSYGKTSMKELLVTVLQEGKKVAATPANKNVSSSHADFANRLEGDEEILIIEYGEGAPGDVARFAENTKPTHAVITGIAPAHIDKYKTLEAAGKDIFSITAFVPVDHVYVNKESPATHSYLSQAYNTYDVHGALGWKISDIKVSETSTSFTMQKGEQKLHLSSGLIGRHQVGSLSFVAALALQLGLSREEVARGIKKAHPFEHRMSPYQLNGAWIIDDTYNGNIEGVRAGTQLLHDLKAKRKIYVTPGLVDQGKNTKQIHHEVGKLVAAANPDLVVLIKNSVCDDIAAGLKAGTYKGQLIIEHDPLNFYSHLKDFVASGDLVVLQNDWPDQYR